MKMKVNTECVIKYLKHDYKIVGEIVGWILLIILGYFAITWLAAVIPPLSEYMILNICAACILLMFTVGIAVFCDKSAFEYRDSETGECGTINSGFFVTIGMIILVFAYAFYILSGDLRGGWEDPTVSFVIVAILFLLGCPVGCAIARCKE